MALNASKPMGIRRIQVSRASELPSDCAATPGGTMFGTTPGGTKIIYDRLYLMKIRDSPASQTPPTRLPLIPGVTAPKVEKTPSPLKENGAGESPKEEPKIAAVPTPAAPTPSTETIPDSPADDMEL